MRRTVAVVCIALGVFCLTMAPMLRFWLASAVMKTPMDYYSETVNRGEDVTYFSAEEVESIEGATVEAYTTLRADVAASDDEVVVWDQFTWVEDIDRDFAILSTTRRAGHDRVSGEAADCCDASVNDESVAQSGQAFKFPFLTEQRDYEFFDTTSQQTLPIEYEGTETIEGMEVYRFVQVVEPTKVGERVLPKSLLEMGGEGDATTDEVYSVTRTYWIEPSTGVPVNLREEQRRVAEVDGEEQLVLFEGSLEFTDETVDNALETASQSGQITLIRTTLPITLVVVGGGLLILGVLLYVSGRPAPSRRH
ncbi:hypothetical protein HDA32_004696 [Spinactinospora alkalitolerans]|uniref:DUF3068 domain-containing protein n=1 Tax=Spinactinospora alkalitolerans TaxID=687207 RepID=A0A852TYF0_9ACTN|nr:DUF3068 domain-containing protein [Spinactinospora alkalitolerans]NYE49576.1 hypothetical protein [Spinactinospora alkalitolerans]